MAIDTSLSHVFPLGSRLNERGHLEVGGCSALELAREFGTPAYVVDEEDLRARARAFRDAATQSGHPDLAVVFASKAFPCTAVLRLFAHEGLWCDVASAGELHLALRAGFPAERIVVHGNAKSTQELEMALAARVGFLVIDNFDEIERLAGLLAGAGAGAGGRAGGPPQAVLVRATPDVRGRTHEKISTGQADSKFGFAMDDIPLAVERIERIEGLRMMGVHAHIGSQLLELEPFQRAVEELSTLGRFPVWDLGGGLGVAYTAEQRPPEIEEYVHALVAAARERGLGEQRLLIEPGRALSANGCVTLYEVQSVKRNVSTWVAVDGGMSDNLRPMLYGARYEAHIVDRPFGSTPCVLTGKHCESGDVIVADARLDEPRAGDVVAVPATGAYGYAMANNYNGALRAPVIFCAGGDARAVVRREGLDELTARDVA